jgi:hypothetical protein
MSAMSWRYTSDPIGARMATLPDFRSRSLVGEFQPYQNRQDQADGNAEPPANTDTTGTGQPTQPAPPEEPSTLPFLVAMLAEHMPTAPTGPARSTPAATSIGHSGRRDRLI